MLEFKCSCGRQLKVSNDLAGWQTQCPGCQKLIPVPSPEDEIEAAPEPKASAALPWKGIAIGASAVAVLAIIVAVALAGGSQPGPDEDTAMKLSRLKKQLDERDQDIEKLNAEVAKLGPLAKQADRVRTLETERDTLRRQLQEALRPKDPATQASAPTATQDPPPAKQPDVAKTPESQEESEAELFARCARTVVTVSSDRGVGGGFFVSADGLVVTCYRHVTQSNSRRVAYITGKGSMRLRNEVDAVVVAVDRKNDLALLKASVPKLVDYAGMETGWGIAVGQELLLWEPPPAGTTLVEHSLSRGGAVALDNVVEGFKYIQTVIPINASNYGVPLFNRMGKVVGITTQKGEASNLAATVIPVAFVAELFNNRETTFSVGRSFSEFEAGAGVAGPVVALRPTDIKVDTVISRMILDEENDRIVGIDVEKNGIIVVSVSKKKVLRTIPTGTDPTEIQATGNPDVYWVSHIGARNLVKVNVTESRVIDRVDIGGHFRRFAASRNHVWAYGGNDHGFLVSLRDKKVNIMQDRFYGMAWDRRRDRIIGIFSTADRSGMCEFEPDKVGNLVRDRAEIKAEGSRGERWKELQDVEKDLSERIKFWPAPPESSNWFLPGGAFTIIIDSSPHLYINRSVIKAKQMDQIVATFKPAPYTTPNPPGTRDAIERFLTLDRIQSGSSDGRWIATGSHIYSTETFSVHKELPILTPASAFSGDSRTLYIYDLGRRAIVPVEVEAKK